MIRNSIVALVVLFVLLIPSVYAASDVYMVLGSEELSGCPCNTLQNTLTVTNTGDTTDTFTFSLDLPEGWSGFIKPEGIFAVGETRNINFYITPACFIEPGSYTVKVSAKTSDGREFIENVDVDVLRCHDVEIQAEELKTGCAGFPADYKMVVKNLGKVSETFTVEVTTSWGEDILSASMDIDKQKNETFDVSVMPPSAGTHYITIVAQSQDSYAKAEKKLQLDMENCYDFSLDLQPEEETVCLGGSGKYVLSITNRGSKEDTYKIYAPEWVIMNQDSIKVSPNTERSVGLFAYPEMEGKNTFEIKVVSSSYGKVVKMISGVANTIECKDVAVIVSPAEDTVCQAMTKEFEVTVKNTGTVGDSFELSTDVGTLEKNKVVLEAGEVETVKLTIDSGKMDTGIHKITVTARSGNVVDQNIVSLTVEDCYSLEFDVKPKKLDACTGDKIEYAINLKNTGKFPEEYTLKVDEQVIGTVFLTPGESKIVNTTLLVSYPFEEVHNLTFKAVSKRKSFESLSELGVKAKEKCYSVEMSAERVNEVKRIEIGTGLSIPLKIRNAGEREDTYKVSVDGPSWIHLSDEQISLKSGEEEKIYLYASPAFGVEDGIYTAVVGVSSENAENQLNFKLGIGNATAPAQQPGQNQTNVSVGGPPTGMIPAGGATGKVILLGVITLFIIIILALKLVLFVK